jgi:hypothetical protein
MSTRLGSLFIKEPARAKEVRFKLEISGEALKSIKATNPIKFEVGSNDEVVFTNENGKKLGHVAPDDLAKKLRGSLKANQKVEGFVIERIKGTVDVLIKTEAPLFQEEEELTEDIRTGGEEGETEEEEHDEELDKDETNSGTVN